MSKFFTLRVWVLLISLILAITAIHPQPWVTGVAITGVSAGSDAANAGFTIGERMSPVQLERITSINGEKVKNLASYQQILESLPDNSTLGIDTNKNSYLLVKNGEIGLTVVNAPKSNIRTGLDLQGGTRILLEPADALDTDGFNSLRENVEKRLNIFGLSDIKVSIINDAPVAGKPQYLLVEIAGAGIDQVRTLISRQGKFEAKIANETVFLGTDVKAVGADPRNSGVDPRSCQSDGAGLTHCSFNFPITLSLEAAQSTADATRNLTVISGQGGNRYLSESLELYLDDVLVDSLSIAADLKGRVQPDISITGSGSGPSYDAAVKDALENMKELQTVLKTGGLPSKLEIVRADTISANLGDSFIKNAMLVGFASILAVALVMFVRYRNLRIVLPMMFATVSEIVLLFGFAAVAGWYVDLAAIAGIIIILGTGIDHQIIVTDEILNNERKRESWKRKLKNAFGIIFVAYMTTVVSMLPLLFAGAGILKGFALTTIIGVTLGIFITRPAYGSMAENLLESQENKKNETSE